MGAIRWDAWYDGNRFEKNLVDRQWQSRHPFYTNRSPDGKVSIVSDRNEIMAKEIALAREAGLDYWAFCYYGSKPDASAARFSYGLRRYLAATDKRDLNFSLILQPEFLGPKGQWRETIQDLIRLFKEPAYQKVVNGRPLVFIFNPIKLLDWAGSGEAAKAAFDELDKAALQAGLPEPYLVAQSSTVESSRRLADLFGLDAISAYTLPENGSDGERPYLDLTRANRNFWNECKTSAKQVIPLVNVGWDNRPRRTSPDEAKKLQGPWYLPPTPGEIAVHLYSAILWVRNNPEYSEAKAVIMYAWNESDEGGWLVPTISEGNVRLEAVKAALDMR